MKKVYSLIIALSLGALLFAQNISSNNDVSANDLSGSVQQAMSNTDYMVTAGDVYSLTYAANGVPVNYTIAVDPTYKIRVSNLAVLDVYGKSYITVKKQVEEIVQKNYPMSGAQFVLLNPASFKVVVTGEVNSTTERSAWALTRLSSVIEGTTTNYSSIRDITITSTNGKTKTCDLFKAIRFGDFSQNPYVRPGDVITINRIKRVVTIKGAVERPGTYELMKDENLKELIEYYGNGLTPKADPNRIMLTHYVTEESKLGNAIYLQQDAIESNFTLINYDTVEIETYTKLKPVLFIEGAIYVTDGSTALDSSNRTVIRFDDNTRYTYLIRNNANLFSSSAADISKAYINRKGVIIPLNISEILYNPLMENDLTVEPFDTIIVPFRQLFVTVAGAVYAPGRYPYIPDRTADYYIGLAGGFIKDKNWNENIKIVDIDGNQVNDKAVITPECTITAPTNSFSYYFGKYAPIITTTASLITTTISVIVTSKNLSGK